MNKISEYANIIWSSANTLRGSYIQSEWSKIILPFFLLRRFDCTLKPLGKIATEHDDSLLMSFGVKVFRLDPNYNIYNTSILDFSSLSKEPDNITINLEIFISGFSSNVKSIIIDGFDFLNTTRKIKKNILNEILKAFKNINLGFDEFNNEEIGLLFDELLDLSYLQSDNMLEEFLSPQDISNLMVNILFAHDQKMEKLKIYDPACGSGSFLLAAKKHLNKLNPNINVELFGQDYNGEIITICQSRFFIRNESIENIKQGNTLINDCFQDQEFDYILSNPPFGLSWAGYKKPICNEAENGGRFNAGLPVVSDASLLFVQHMISKIHSHTSDMPSRIALIVNGSVLVRGSAGSGESNIRRWIIENDFLESIIALPTELHYNTSIATYIWIITSCKEPKRKGKIQLINATDMSAIPADLKMTV